jgi:IS5 family transposase
LIAPRLLLPTYSVICRRAKELEKALPKLSKRRAATILLDASGFKVYGEGEWKVKMHGKTKRRKWIKLHLSIDEASQEIVGMAVTEGTCADCKVAKNLIEKRGSRVKEVKADGAYDTKGIRNYIEKQGGVALIPPKKNAVWKSSTKGRGKSAAEMRGLGYDKIGRSLWSKLTGYSKRSLVETTFSRLQKMFGPSFFSREEARQRVEGHIQCVMMNRMLQAMR